MIIFNNCGPVFLTLQTNKEEKCTPTKSLCQKFSHSFSLSFIVKVYGCSMSSVFMLQTSIGEDLKTSFDGRDSDISECIDQFSLQFDNIEEARWLERMASASASYGMKLCIQSLSSFSFGTFSTLFQQNFWQSYKLTTSALFEKNPKKVLFHFYEKARFSHTVRTKSYLRQQFFFLSYQGCLFEKNRPFQKQKT